MTGSESDTPAPAFPAFKDRRGSLVFGGIIELALGVLWSLVVPLMMLGVLLSPENVGPRPATQIPGVLTGVLAAVFFIWVGIGSIRARRWARAIMLVVSWLWLVGGTTAFLSWLLLRSSFSNAMLTAGGDVPATMVHVVEIVITTTLGVFYVALPVLLLLLYRGNDVKATCESRDPVARWTDAVPLPVLGVSLCLGYAAVSSLLSICYGVLPLFGRLVTGSTAVVLAVVLAAILSVLAFWAYELRPAGWWGCLLLVVLGTGSSVITFVTVDMPDLYASMGFREPQLAMMKDFWPGKRLVWWVVAYAIASAGYLVYVKRYFTSGTPAAEGPTPSP